MPLGAGLLGGSRAGGRGRVGKRRHVRQLAGGGMESLPQRGEDLHAVEHERLDPGLGELCLRELCLPEVVGCGPTMRPPTAPSAARHDRLPKPAGELVLVRMVRDGDPPARRDRRLLGTGGVYD